VTYRRSAFPVFPVALLATALSLVACSGTSSTASSSTTQSSASGSTSTSASAAQSSTLASSAPSPSASASSPTVSDVSPGAATDFCSAYKEFKTAVQADTPQAQGAGFRTAAADLRRFAPAEIKKAAGLFADVMDEVGQGVQAGKPNPEVLGSGQSAERRQGLADSLTWITKNCPA
jgi:hypothetical protein